MKVYLCAQFARQNEMCSYREDLLQVGWHVTSTWLDEIEDSRTDPAVYAYNDILDIDNSDAVIFFSGPPYLGSIEECSRGGRHFELGYAFHAGKTCILIGGAENIFHSLPNMIHFQSWAGFYRSLHV